MKRAAALLFLFFLLSEGCVAYHPKPISPAKTAADFESRRLTGAGSWNLSRLVLVAYAHHPDMDVVRAQWGVATAGIRSAGARPNPTLQFSPEYATNPDAGLSPWVLGFNLDVPIETAGKRHKRIAEAKHHAEALRFNIATVAWQVRSRLREAFLNLFAADQSISILEKEQKLQVENVTLIVGRVAMQQVSPFTVSQAEAARDRSALALSDSHRQSAESRARVADALGLPLKALEGIQLSFDNIDRFPRRVSTEEVQCEALTNRADLLAALEEYAASEASLQLEIAKQYPDIHLGPGYIWDQGQHKWTLGLSLMLPIFDHNKGPIAEAEARRKESEARFIALQAHVIGEVARTLAAYRGALATFKVADDLLSDEEKKHQFISGASGVGELRRVALLNAQIDIDAAALSRLTALVDVQKSLGQLEDVVQKPLGRWGE